MGLQHAALPRCLAIVGGAVSVFAKAYAGIVSGSLDCLDSEASCFRSS